MDSPSTIASDIFDRITLNPAINGYVEVEMTEGKIRLSGVVKSYEERIKAASIARELFKGVVINDLIVNSGKRSNDAKLLNEIESEFAVEAEMSQIGPRSVEKGVVVLEGSAPSRWVERKAMGISARIPGVKSVISEVIIKNERNDEEISNDIEMAFHEDPTVHAEFIGAETKRGTVKLSGLVSEPVQKERALRIASAVKGVRHVVDDVEVESYPESIDARLEKEILSALGEEKINLIDLNVSVIDGVALIEGEVDSPIQMERARKAAANVRGVRDVLNALVVSSRK